MLYAARIMIQASRDYQHRYNPNSKLYEAIRREFSRTHSDRLRGRNLSPSHRDKISASLKGRKDSAETIEKRRIANTGKKRSADARQKMIQAQLNRAPLTAEERLTLGGKISQGRKGKGTNPKSEEHRAKLSQALLGKPKEPLSEETKQKMRKPKSEEHKANMRKPKSPEHIQSIKEAKLRKKLNQSL
jgi:hypothetical protein